MHIKLLFKLVVLTSLTCSVFADNEDECTTIDNFLNDTDISLEDCVADENGKAINLELRGGKLTQDVIDELSDYEMLETLNINKLDYSEEVTLKSLSNVKYFVINDVVNAINASIRNNYLKKDFINTLPSTIEKLEISGFLINQETINELGEMTLNELNFFKCNFDDGLDFSPLKNTKNLTALQLFTFNKPLNAIPEGIGAITNLKSLDFFSNNLSTIPDFIGNLKNLEHLDLSSNRIKSIPTSFGNLTNLKYLDISYNKLATIPDVLKNLKKLEYLNLERNRIIDLNSVIGELTNLKQLNVFGNKIMRISDGIKNLSNLVEINLSKNKIASLPSFLNKLKSLENLYAYNNYISIIPDNIGDLSNLKKINLCSNSIAYIPNSIGNLKNLKTLMLSDNKIRVIPDSIGNLKSLSEIYLDDNEIESIPDAISNLESLTVFELRNNRVTKFNDGLGKLINLKLLDLNNNLIDDILPESLNNLKYLEIITLNDNINIKGKTLTNKSLISCYYNSDEMNYSICRAAKSTCLGYWDDSMLPCDN